jgi:hypothetical protein
MLSLILRYQTDNLQEGHVKSKKTLDNTHRTYVVPDQIYSEHKSDKELLGVERIITVFI